MVFVLLILFSVNISDSDSITGGVVISAVRFLLYVEKSKSNMLKIVNIHIIIFSAFIFCINFENIVS